MKQSPLQLKWVAYPTASYESVEAFEGFPRSSAPVDLQATLAWELDGEHTASLLISSREEEGVIAPYIFTLAVTAIFSFDAEDAKRAFRSDMPAMLPAIVAVNIVQILYGAARERIAEMTSRAPFGPVQLESVFLNPQDIQMGSSAEPVQVFKDVFNLDDEVIAGIERAYSEISPPRKSAAARKGSRKRVAKKGETP